MKLKITEIRVEMKYFPRLKLDEYTIERYMEAYEIGDPLPSIIVQSENYILIDGFHRLEAQKRLGRVEVEVELLDIPENQIYVKAVGFGGEHGLPPNKEDVNEQIFQLKVTHGLTYEAIGKLEKMHGTTVRNRLHANPKFSNLNIQNTKSLDGRTKNYDSKEILDRHAKGETGVEIASVMPVSTTTISNVIREEREKQERLDKYPIVIEFDGYRFRDIFQSTTLGGKHDVKLNFQEDALYITSSNKKDNPKVYARFSKVFFDSYSVKEPLTWFVDAKTVKGMYGHNSILHAEYLEMKLEGDVLKMRWEKGEWTIGKGRERRIKKVLDASYSQKEMEVSERNINSIFEHFDEHGLFDESTCVLKISKSEFGGMPEPKDKVTVGFTEDVLTIGGVSRGWKFSKDISVQESTGEDIQIDVNGDAFGKIISNQKQSFNLIIVGGERKAVFVTHSGRYFYVNHLAV